MLSTRAQGQEITRKTSPRESQSEDTYSKPPFATAPATAGFTIEYRYGIKTINTASPITAGVYILANFLINSSVGALRSEASCTIFKMREIALSPKGFDILMFTTLSETIIPARTSPPFFMERGTLSPVRAAVLNNAASETSVPSNGTRSPTLILITCPTTASFELIIFSSPLSPIILAVSGRTSIRAVMLFFALFTALSWNTSPIEYNSITDTASGYCLMHKAPIVAMLMSVYSVKISFCNMFSQDSFITGTPTGKKAAMYHIGI